MVTCVHMYIYRIIKSLGKTLITTDDESSPPEITSPLIFTRELSNKVAAKWEDIAIAQTRTAQSYKE